MLSSGIVEIHHCALLRFPLVQFFRSSYVLFVIKSLGYVANNNTSRSLAHPGIFRQFIMVKLKGYLQSPFGEKLIFAIVAWSTVGNYTVSTVD